MKVLFYLHKRNRLRNFDSLIKALAEGGADVRLEFLGDREKWIDNQERKDALLPQSLRHPRITARISKCVRQDTWADFVSPLRRLRDALRYFDSRYKGSDGLRTRAFAQAAFPVGRAVAGLYGHWYSGLLAAALSRILVLIEDLIPSDPSIEAQMNEAAPDIVLVSPLVQFGSDYQVDLLKAADSLGIPSGFLPFSWDNLTNKGLMRAKPDRVLVWNGTQRREAVELHDCKDETIRVCGAWRFDEFYAMQPRAGREEFCRNVGLSVSRPIITYLCSSESTSKDESVFIKKWLMVLRGSSNGMLNECGVLIRPYPDRHELWKESLFAEFSNVSIMPQNIYDDHASVSWGDQELFDCLYHSAAVVGLNTSAMIEAAILGKPVHTIIADEFRNGQAGTLHFWYFLTVNGGLLHVARDLDEHCRRLILSLSSNGRRDPKSDGFAKAFVRPFGLDRPTMPVVVSEIRELSRMRKLRSRPGRLRSRVAQVVLRFLQQHRGWFLNVDESADDD